MNLSSAVDFARGGNKSVLTTLRGNGLPQLSNVLHQVDAEGVIRISTTADRAKYTNLTRRPWAALKVDGESFWTYVVIEGEVTVSDVAAATDDATVDELVTLFRSLSGEHPNWDEFRTAMVAENRVVVRVHPNRAYGKLT